MFIGIVADDLTGAADSVAPFAKRGYGACVFFFSRDMKPEGTISPSQKDGAIALDTQSRDKVNMRDSLRDLTFRQATRYLVKLSPEIIYKKIDSALRGHLRVELEAMRHVLPERLPVICSAFPANGRTIEQDVLSVHGNPQTQTVREAFGYPNDDTAFNMTLEMLHEGVRSVANRLGAMQQRGTKAVFCDAVMDADLDILAQAMLREPLHYLPVGSAGLSAAFARQMPEKPIIPDITQTVLECLMRGRVLIVVGSQNEISRAQANYLGNFVCNAAIHVKKRTDAKQAAADVLDHFENGRRIVLVTTPDTPMGERTDTIPSGLSLEIHKLCARRNINPTASLIVTGGDTARQMADGFNLGSMVVLDEIEPGIVVGIMFSDSTVSQRFYAMPVILKSGGFGDEKTLAEIVGLE